MSRLLVKYSPKSGFDASYLTFPEINADTFCDGFCVGEIQVQRLAKSRGR